MDTITISCTDEVALTKDGHIVIRDLHGKEKCALRIMGRDPGKIIAEAGSAGENAQLDVLTDAIYHLSEVRDELEAQLKKALEELEGYQNSVRNRMEEMRQKDGELFRVGQQNALLHKDNLQLEQRATEAEAMLAKGRTAGDALLKLEGELESIISRKDLSINLRKKFKGTLARLVTVRQKMINGQI